MIAKDMNKEIFEKIFGKKLIPCKKRRLTKSQKKRNADIQKAVYEYVKKIDDAFEATKNSKLTFN